MQPNLLEVMKARAGIPTNDLFAMLWAKKLRAGSSSVQTLTGIPPLSFKSDGTPLISWSMFGNTKQAGTPSPQNIIMPDFCGKLVGSDWVIPITCAGQTTPVYLGQTQTVRKIKKLVLDGTEKWNPSSTYPGSCFAYFSNIATDAKRFSLIVCTHVDQQSGEYHYGQGRIDKNSLSLWLFDSSVSTETFKSYLAAQYAAGTPVTVWYVLAKPETAIVNEPLAKIGDYADELNSEDAGVTIPTAKGQNTLTVDTDLQPSEMKITFKS